MYSNKKHIVNGLKWILFLFFIIGCQHKTLKAQILTPPQAISVDGQFKKAYLKSELLVLDTAEILSASKAVHALKNLNISRTIQSTSFGFSEHFYWLYFKVKNYSDTTQRLVVVVNNPHINYIQLYEEMKLGVQLIAKGGDGLPFMNRTYIDRRFVAPILLEPRTEKKYALFVDKRHASVSIPIQIENRQYFESESEKDLFTLGIYFGAILLIVLYSMIVYFKTKENIFFWYAFYIFFLGLYLFAQLGLFFQYVHPNLFAFSDYSRPLFVTWLSTGLVRFIQLLIRTKEYLPRIEKYYKILLISLNVVTFWWWFTPWWHDAQTIWFLNIQNFLVIISLIMVLGSAIYTFKKQKMIVTFFLVAFFAILMGGLSVILIEAGIISQDIFPINPILMGSMVEIIVFAFGLSYWMRLMNQERVQFGKEMREVESKLVDSYISGIESEKKKIAAELHDDIGSRLSNLKRIFESSNAPKKDIIAQLQHLNTSVRHLSHELASPRFESDEFLISINHLIRGYETRVLQLSFQVYDLPEVIPPKIQKQLYRVIQTALSNVQTHSQAKSVDIQFFYHDHELILTIEDNGNRVTVESEYVGIKSMQSRVGSLNGTIEISSTEQYGTSIMITIPILNN